MASKEDVLPSRANVFEYGGSVSINDYRPASKESKCIYYSRTFESYDEACDALRQGEDMGQAYTVLERDPFTIRSMYERDADPIMYNFEKEAYEVLAAPKLKPRGTPKPKQDTNHIPSFGDALSIGTPLQQLALKSYHRFPTRSPVSDYYQTVEAIMNRATMTKPLSRRGSLLSQLDRQPTNNHAPSTIYQNRQNVHKTSIQDTVGQSITNLLTDPKPEFIITSILDSPDLSEQTCSTVRSLCAHTSTVGKYGINFETLLLYVWQRIQTSEHRSELISILTEQLRDAGDKCFVGYMSRTIAVLAGFYDDIVIEISVQDHIRGIIEAARISCDPYSTQAHHDLARDRLIDAGYVDEMQSWLRAILDDE